MLRPFGGAVGRPQKNETRRRAGARRRVSIDVEMRYAADLCLAPAGSPTRLARSWPCVSGLVRFRLMASIRFRVSVVFA
jgi:hypothetical protein